MALYIKRCTHTQFEKTRNMFLLKHLSIQAGAFCEIVSNLRSRHVSRSPSANGFSIIEIIIVLALLTSIGGFAMVTSLSQFRTSVIGDDRETLVTLLQHARALSMNGECEGTCPASVAHGVAIATSTFILFQGLTFTSRDRAYDSFFVRDIHTTYSGLSEIVFAPLSGNVATTGDIVISDIMGTTSKVSINNIGRIIWSR